MGRLVSYDLLILRRSAKAAFSAKRDILLLMVALVIGLLIAWQRAGAAAAALDALPIPTKAGMAAAAAFAANLAAARRLAHLRQDSVVARFAMRAAQARAHFLLWNFPALCAATGLILVSSARMQVAVAIVISYPLGIALAGAHRAALSALRIGWARRRAATGARRLELAGEGRRERTIRLLMSRTGVMGSRVAANFLACAGIGLLIGGGHGWLETEVNRPTAAAIAGLPVLLLLLFLLRSHAPLLRYLLFLGNEPVLPALVATSLAAALLAGLLGGLAASASAPLLATLAAGGVIVLLFLAAACLRALHYATRSRQLAEFAIQIDLFAAGVAALLTPPLALVVLIGRLWLLRRRAQALWYLVP